MSPQAFNSTRRGEGFGGVPVSAPGRLAKPTGFVDGAPPKQVLLSPQANTASGVRQSAARIEGGQASRMRGPWWPLTIPRTDQIHPYRREEDAYRINGRVAPLEPWTIVARRPVGSTAVDPTTRRAQFTTAARPSSQRPSIDQASLVEVTWTVGSAPRRPSSRRRRGRKEMGP